MSIEGQLNGAPKKEREAVRDQDLENDPHDPRELRVLKANMAHARRVLRGELMFASMFANLQNSIAGAADADVDVAHLSAEFNEMVEKLPGAEMTNLIGRSEESLQAGDVAAAKSWHLQALNRIKVWENGGAIPADELQEFQDRLTALEASLYT